MNPEMIHDALTLLPGDLITPVDKLRTRPGKAAVKWQRWAALAACLTVLLCTALALQQNLLSRSATKMTLQAPSKAAPAEAPAAAAPMEPEIAQEEAAAPEMPAADSAASVTGSGAPDAGHEHGFAEDSTDFDNKNTGYCGNMVTVVHIDGESLQISGSDSVLLTDLLIHLNYDQRKICNCLGEFTVDTEMLTGIEVNLTQGYARCEKGQADLTQAQVQTLQEIMDRITE